MAQSTILKTLCVLSVSILLPIQSADVIDPGYYATETCSGNCNILCSNTDGCRGAIFYITNTVPISVDCTGSNACSGTVFYHAGSADVEHTCNGDGTCANAIIYTLNPLLHLNCKEHAGGDTCASLSIIDLIPPASGQMSITVEASEAAGMAIFSPYHKTQTFNCVNSCTLSNIIIYFGLKFNEYCYASDSSCVATQSSISDTVYGAFTIMDTLSGAYGTSYDFSATQMNTNVLLVLADHNDEYSTFSPPAMSDSSTFLSVLCVECRAVNLDFTSVNNVILTGANLYSTQDATLNGPMDSFMVNSYVDLSVSYMTMSLNTHENVAITINTAYADIYLGTNVDVEVNCGGPGYNCYNLRMYSDADPATAEFFQFIVDCAGTCQNDKTIFVYFPTHAPSLECEFTNSGVSAGCEFFMDTKSPTGAPTTPAPTQPSLAPTAPTLAPTKIPTATPTTTAPTQPSLAPTAQTSSPTKIPTAAPSAAPSQPPTAAPSASPSQPPTVAPSNAPTQPPTAAPSLAPTRAPSNAPTSPPTLAPTGTPTPAPTLNPTMTPTFSPTRYPTAAYPNVKLITFVFDGITNDDKDIIAPNDKIAEAVIDDLMFTIEDIYVSGSKELGIGNTLEYRHFQFKQDDAELERLGVLFHKLTLTSEVQYNETKKTLDQIAFLSRDPVFEQRLLNGTRDFFVDKGAVMKQMTVQSVEIEEVPVIEPETDYVLLSLGVFLCLMFIISIAAKLDNGDKFRRSKVDNSDWMAPAIFGLQIFDLVTDMNLSYEILGRFGETPPEGAGDPMLLVVAGLGCTFFVMLPWFVNIGFAMRIKSYVQYNKKASGYFQTNIALFIPLVVFSGATYPSLQLLSSHIFGYDPLNSGLTLYELRTELFKLKIWGNVMLENLPQLICQVLYMIYNGGVTKTIMLSFAASLMSILVSLFTFCVEKQKSKDHTQKAIQYDLFLKPTRELTESDEKVFKANKGRKGSLRERICGALEVPPGVMEIGAWVGTGVQKRLHIVHYHPNVEYVRKQYEDKTKKKRAIREAFNAHFEKKEKEEKDANDESADKKKPEQLYKIRFIENWESTSRNKNKKVADADSSDDDDDAKADENGSRKKRGPKVQQTVALRERKATVMEKRYRRMNKIIREVSRMKLEKKYSQEDIQLRLLKKYPEREVNGILKVFKMSARVADNAHQTTPGAGAEKDGAVATGHADQVGTDAPLFGTTPGGE